MNYSGMYCGITRIYHGILEFQSYINEFDSFEDAFVMMYTTLSQQIATCACTSNILLSRIDVLTTARGADFKMQKTFKTMSN